MLVDLPPFYKKMNPARSLEVLFENTTKTYREISDSVHSKTLETLYTDTFRPENLHAGETTVMDIKTGNPIKALVDYIVIYPLIFHIEKSFLINIYQNRNSRKISL